MMSTPDEKDWIAVEPGGRVFIDFGSAEETRLFGGLGTVTRITAPWTAYVKRDADGLTRLYVRWMLKPADAIKASDATCPA